MRIYVAGATGALGRRLVPPLVSVMSRSTRTLTVSSRPVPRDGVPVPPPGAVIGGGGG